MKQGKVLSINADLLIVYHGGFKKNNNLFIVT
jgi:hypothetical protein